jgi:hypothetical protein
VPPPAFFEELTASGRDKGVGTDHPIQADIPYILRVIAPTPIKATTPGRADWAWRLILATSRQPARVCWKPIGSAAARGGREETGQHIVQLRASPKVIDGLQSP